MSKSPRKERDALWKWVVIGDSGVGKTAILSRLCNDEFNNTFISTIGIDFKIKKMEFNGQNITIQIWDTAGQERFGTITKSCYRGSNGILLCYDITNRTSFEDVNKWLKDIQIMNNSEKHAGDTVAKILLGNKFDMEGSNRAVAVEEAQAVAQKNGIPFVEVSAKSGKNIERAFVMLAELILGETTTNYSNSNLNSNNKNSSNINSSSNNSKETTTATTSSTTSSSNPGNKSMLGLVSRNNKSNSSSNTTFASSLFSASSTGAGTSSSSSSSPTPTLTPTLTSTSVSISTTNHGSENQSSFSNEDSDVIRLGNFHPSSPSKTNPTSNSGSNPNEEENLFDPPVRKSRCC